jgi:hypothetical protein
MKVEKKRRRTVAKSKMDGEPKSGRWRQQPIYWVESTVRDVARALVLYRDRGRGDDDALSWRDVVQRAERQRKILLLEEM